MDKKTLRRRYLLEGALGYIVHLSGQIREGKIKTIQELSAKLNEDGPTGGGALAILFEKDLKTAGYECGFLDDEEESKMQEKQELPQNVWLYHLNRLDPETRELLEKEAKLVDKEPEQLLKEKAAVYLEELKAKHKQQNS